MLRTVYERKAYTVFRARGYAFHTVNATGVAHKGRAGHRDVHGAGFVAQATMHACIFFTDDPNRT